MGSRSRLVGASLLVVVVSSCLAIDSGQKSECSGKYSKVGCFTRKRDGSMLFSDRNIPNGIDWVNYPTYLQGLACRCAAEAKKSGGSLFLLTYWGECWSVKVSRTDPLDMSKCSGSRPKLTCSLEHPECIGNGDTDFYYRVDAVENADGNYTSWSAWESCTKTCDEGTSRRTRTCTAPAPSGSGRSCDVLGPSQEFRVCMLVSCPIDGQMTSWSSWGVCTSSCGASGVKVRTRACNNPAPAFGGKNCDAEGPLTQTKPCEDNPPCPVDGNYSDWSQWSICSATCGQGQRTRSRECNHPAPAFGGSECGALGPSQEVQECPNLKECPVNGGYGQWSSWKLCSTTCGSGIQSRHRQCNSPPPSFGGKDCSEFGFDSDVRPCPNLQPCPIDGRFSDWSAWSQCTASCGSGTQLRTRTCSNPPPAYGGLSCPLTESEAETRVCPDLKFCPVDGGYSEWSGWSSCSSSCGNGTQTRSRACTAPAPAFNGRDCSPQGPAEESKYCPDLHPCPVDGGYSEWSDWSQCSATCDSGKQQRTRSCTNPSPAFGGQDCSSLGTGDESQKCADLPECPEDERYSQWSQWSACSATCGNATQERTRELKKVPQKSSVRSTSSSAKTVETKQCDDLHPCPVNGGYSEWSSWSKCSTSCGLGQQLRFRECSNPSPAFGGQDCSGLGVGDESRGCTDLPPCPVDGGYGQWSKWSTCSSTCGSGTQSRNRECSNPYPDFGGQDCIVLGPSTQSKPCENLVPCPVNGGYSEWSQWSDCSGTCGLGQQLRHRTCSNPTPAFGGQDCKGLGFGGESRACPDLLPCPVDGGYTPWSAWSACNSLCGIGVQKQYRLCEEPAPSHGGRDCSRLGASEQTKPCDSLPPCPVNGGYSEWSDWSKCSSTCDSGQQFRSRTCTKPSPAFGGHGCDLLGTGDESRSCSKLPPCPVNGGYSEWTNWSPCSAECGEGFSTRARSCSSPEPLYGGRDCLLLGKAKEEKICSKTPCPVNGDFSEWSAWSKCSMTCGSGLQTSFRECNNPAPAHGGKDCSNLGAYTRVQDCANLPQCRELPRWPEDFVWSYDGVLAGYICIQVYSNTGLQAWSNNFFCFADYAINPRLIWSPRGAIKGMKCVDITWSPSGQSQALGSLCGPPDSPYNFRWSLNGPIDGSDCIEWLEPTDTRGLGKSFLCSDSFPVQKSFNNVPLSIDDMVWSSDGQPSGKRCIRLGNEKAGSSWANNYLCHSAARKDPGIRWSNTGPISRMSCAQVTLPRSLVLSAWTSSFLCSPKQLPYRIVWSFQGSLPGVPCLPTSDPEDPSTKNSHFCFYGMDNVK